MGDFAFGVGFLFVKWGGFVVCGVGLRGVTLFCLYVVGEKWGMNQSAFVPNRHIQDNILLSQELLKGYERKEGPKRIAMKVDIQKAYDTVNRKFLKEILNGFGFHERMVHWIMSCVTTMAFSICVNGKSCRYFKGGRGLRQGDPISPYLFTLVMEMLTLIAHDKVDTCKEFKLPVKYLGVLLTSERPSVNNCIVLIDKNIVNEKKSLWVKWANTVKLKGKSIWAATEDVNDSWGWKKYSKIEIRDMYCGNSINSIVRRLCLAASVYLIWQERNYLQLKCLVSWSPLGVTVPFCASCLFQIGPEGEFEIDAEASEKALGCQSS
uniref:RNA-directed DNA polymerase, eukaryota, reverse transcriptase zinc-binding domain protein n=1 Tax=Tanacetum cinerariifolium TaxID=118510 RepID=A0A6L2NCB7_TANCI|nr:RNA-directed DNA polymerase, eukaryota, reverse transcriptase zinc-binding domain protein [Tanacetum cinerariifolium]